MTTDSEDLRQNDAAAPQRTQSSIAISEERRTVEAVGWEVSYDGMDIEL